MLLEEELLELEDEPALLEESLGKWLLEEELLELELELVVSATYAPKEAELLELEPAMLKLDNVKFCPPIFRGSSGAGRSSSVNFCCKPKFCFSCDKLIAVFRYSELIKISSSESSSSERSPCYS